jgi:hypothetical protein
MYFPMQRGAGGYYPLLGGRHMLEVLLEVNVDDETVGRKGHR